MTNHPKLTLPRTANVAVLIALLLSLNHPAQAGQLPDRLEQKPSQPLVQTSPFPAPTANDVTFVVDDSPGLDTGCTFRSGGPLRFEIPVTRFVGDVQKLLDAGAIERTAVLEMPAFDVDFDGAPGLPPERDLVTFNGVVVEPQFLSGGNNLWKLNGFKVPVETILFPPDPGDGHQIQPRMNRVEISIDILSPPDEENWCTSIDWAALRIKAARPNLFVHGIFPAANGWSPVWTGGLNTLGIPSATIEMGRLDSIGANAGKIANRVAILKNRWGVDALNIVSHSKGGIDSRHYIETSEDITRLIQIGTPNAGSPLADYLEAGAFTLLGPSLTFVANALAGGPGGYQLTVIYMTLLYNPWHLSNRETKYHSVAGVYSGGGPLYTFLNAILPGDDDTIVPKWSVHALPYGEKTLFFSTGENEQASHIGQTGSQGIFDDLLLLTRTPQDKSPFVQGMQEVPGVAVPTSIVTGTLRQGEGQTRTVPVDHAGPGSFVMFYGTGDLNMTLTSPSGQHIGPGTPGIVFEAKEATEGFKSEAYHLGNMEVGVWTVAIAGATIPDPPGAETYFISAWLETSTISLAAASRASSYSAGQPVVIEATLRDGAAPLVNANVTATFRLPNDTFVNVLLQDSGASPDLVANDGIYTGALSQTALGGIYQVGITASGGSPAFSRSAFLVVPVSASTSHFTGIITDQGVDTNQNSLFDQLAVDVEIAVTQQANYFIVGQLETESGQLLGSVSMRRALSPGTSVVRLAFDGRAIFRQGVDGPYRLNGLRLAEETPAGDVLPLDIRQDVYHTAAYSYRSFERDAIYLAGTGQDDGIDTNNNGLFDLLSVGIDVDLLVGGQYEWTARLVDKNGTEIGFASRSGFLPAGPGSLALVFDGTAIGRNGVDGPYRVVDLLIFGSGKSEVVFDAYTTKPYTAQQFEGFEGVTPLSLSPAHVWVGLKNSDDVGTQFDLKVEFLKNGSPVASGLQRCVTGVALNPALAKETIVPFDAFGAVPIASGDVLALRVSTRIGTTPAGAKCSGPGGSHNSALALRLYHDSASRASRFDATLPPSPNKDLYLHSDGGPCGGTQGTNRILDANAPAAANAKCKDSGKVNFAGGNPFSVIGTWSLAPLP